MSLLSHLFSKSSPAARVTPYPDEPVHVIGDIHGRGDLLARLLGKLEIEAPGTMTVCVGDYIDRGDHSAAVLRMLMDCCADPDGNFICIAGNHERMLLDFLGAPTDRGSRWLRNGGLQTLASFGVTGITANATGDDLIVAARDLRAAMGKQMISWMRELPLFWQNGNLGVVHAGADPEIPLHRQSRRAMIWGHPTFLNHIRADSVCVAHGHTVVDAAEHVGSRIALDTGAYFSGVLSAARIEPDGTVRFLHS